MPETHSRSHLRKVVYIYEEARNHEGKIDDVDFVDCQIVGPAVLAIVRGVTMSNMGIDPDILWPPADPTRQYFGLIPVTNTEFRNCRFEKVGLLATADFTRDFRRALGLTD
jgi:hypothetical protein